MLILCIQTANGAWTEHLGLAIVWQLSSVLIFEQINEVQKHFLWKLQQIYVPDINISTLKIIAVISDKIYAPDLGRTISKTSLDYHHQSFCFGCILGVWKLIHQTQHLDNVVDKSICIVEMNPHVHCVSVSVKLHVTHISRHGRWSSGW